MSQFVQIEGEAANQLRASEKVDNDAIESGELCPDIWFWNDATDPWLYDTGMIQHFKSDKVFYDSQNDLFLVFKLDAVGVTPASNFPELKP